MNTDVYIRQGSPRNEPRLAFVAPSVGVRPTKGVFKPIVPERWVPWVFASKTTISALLALLVAFTFNLDQPKWALLTVFIVAQPQSGLVLAKSFYRIIGTLVGAVGALVLVSLFAQERVLFLGSLAIWIGLCTFGSRYVRNFASYGFVLSGYTVAIVGVSGALDPGSAFYVAVARVTEISLGIMTAAAISHLFLPIPLADSLRRTIAAGRKDIVDYAVGLLGGKDTTSLRTKLLGHVIAINDLRASAVFEDRDIRNRSDALRRLNIAMISVTNIGQLLDKSSHWLVGSGELIEPTRAEALKSASTAMGLWGVGRLTVGALKQHFVAACARLPLAREFYRKPASSDAEIIQTIAAIIHLRDFLAALVGFADACDDFSAAAPKRQPSDNFSIANDPVGALWAGLRAAAALLLVGAFWILADWPTGTTAAILVAVATARLATMEHSLKAAVGGTVLVSLAALPFFIVIEVLLPQAGGFVMFVLIVAPTLFCCSYLMARPKTAGLGFIASLYFAYVSAFQDRMSYDPVGFLNSTFAVALAIGASAVLFAIIDPDTPRTARRRFTLTVRKIFERIAAGRPNIRLVEFETATADALSRLRSGLRPDRKEDLDVVEAGIALLGAGRELIQIRDGGSSGSADTQVMGEVVCSLTGGDPLPFGRARRLARAAAAICLAELRDGSPGVASARALARKMVAFTAISDQLGHAGPLFVDSSAKEAPVHAA